MEKLWTTAEVAQYLKIHELDVEQLVREELLTGYRLGGQFLRFRPDQVKALQGKVRFRRTPKSITIKQGELWQQKVREFLYLYDFYVISAALLAVLAVYLIAVG